MDDEMTHVIAGRSRPVRILAVGAHPDDVELGCGGTLARLSHEACEVVLLVASRGELGGDPVVRCHEQRLAARLLGISSVIIGAFADGQLASAPLEDFFAARIEEIQPHRIYIHHPGDDHPDHRAVARAGLDAAPACVEVFLYEGPTSVGFCPTEQQVIGTVLERKLSAIRAHASQVEKAKGRPGILDFARAAAAFRGLAVGADAAEGFVSLRGAAARSLGGASTYHHLLLEHEQSNGTR